jgi:uncharacterized membrane protein YdfJ with MMPL/SSD domain
VQSKNLAARAARWSAGHRKTAIFGWLAFVVIAFFLAASVGQKTIADEDYGNGSSKTADKAIAAADFRDSADEQVLLKSSRASTRSSRHSPRATRASSPRTAVRR